MNQQKPPTMHRNFIYIALTVLFFGCASNEFSQRKVISLNGEWDIEELYSENEIPSQ